jgi:recombination protein RecR
MRRNTDPVEHLIALLAKLPGLGRRSARRAALRMLMAPETRMLPLADALRAAAEAVQPCRVCGNLDSAQPCRICATPSGARPGLRRRGRGRAVGAGAAHAHQGLYHVLGGTLSALAGVGPEELSVTPLLRRVGDGGVSEVILALPATVEGASTAHYLDRPPAADRRAGDPPGAGRAHRRALDVLDDGTLAQALKARREA